MHTSSPTKYFVSEGVRGEYWAWKAAEKDPVGSVEMNMAYRAVLRALGVKEVFMKSMPVIRKYWPITNYTKMLSLKRLIYPMAGKDI